MNQKLAQLLIYVAHKLAEDRRNGKTKIHKILFFSDFEAYRQKGTSISGEHYRKYDRGPFLQKLDSTVAKLRTQNRAEWAPINEFKEIRLVPWVPIDTSLLADWELAIVDSTIARFWGWSAEAVSNFSHRLFGWMTTPNGQVIDYASAYVGEPRALGSTETALALDLIGRYREWKREKAEYCP